METASELLKDFDAALRKIQGAFILPFIPMGGELTWLNYEQTGFVVAAHWVVRNRLGLWSKREHPFNTSLFKKYESWGQHLTDLLALCIACDDESPHPSPYKNGFAHWALCVQEIRFFGLNQILNTEYNSIRSYERALRKDLQALKNFDNPFDVNKERHAWALFSAAQPLAEATFRKKGGFYDRYYLPYLNSQHTFIKELGSCGWLFLKKNPNSRTLDLRIKQGSGRGEIKVQKLEFGKLNFVTLVP